MSWENYFLKSGSSFTPFWEEYLLESKRDILFIMGMGFDPRTNIGIKTIYSIKSRGLKSTIILRYYNQAEDVSTPNNPLVQKHLMELTSFLSIQSLTGFTERNVIHRSEDNKSIASINATQIFNEADIKDYSDIIIDISAMPRGVFLPLINKLFKFRK